MFNDEHVDYWEHCHADMTIIDAIYYPGVREGMTRFLRTHTTRSAYLIFTAYTDKPGMYHYYDGEGYFKITNDNGRTYITNSPKDNPISYKHRLFKWNVDRPVDFIDTRGIHW